MDDLITQITNLQLSPLKFINNLQNNANFKGDNCKLCAYDEKKNIVYQIFIPNNKLDNIKTVEIASLDDIKKLPKTAGCYWIITDAPIRHCFNKGDKIPAQIENSIILYNGSATSLQHRAEEHLLRPSEKSGFGMISGISIDIITTPTKGSHAKCLWCKNKKKLPKINNTNSNNFSSLSNKDDIIKYLYLSDEEKTYITNHDEIYFKNGINVENAKHKKYKYIFYYIEESNSVIRNYIETEWRKMYGTPILCSYLCGR